MPGTRLVLVLALGLAPSAPPALRAREGSTVRLDRFGDPLPEGAVARLGTVRFHGCGCAAYSPDGKSIATANGDEVSLWDVATSAKIRRLRLKDRVSAVGLIFSRDGKKLAAIGWGGTALHVWDLDTFTEFVLAQTDGGGVGGDWGHAAAFSSDDKTLYAATSTKLFVWDLASGKKRAEFPFRVGDKPVPAGMVAFSDDGTVAATQSDGKVYLWDTRTGGLRHEVVAVSFADVMRFSRDGKTLVVAGGGHWMNVFSVATGKKLPSLPVANRVVSLAFSPDGRTLAAASNPGSSSSSIDEGDQVIQFWDLEMLRAPPAKIPAPGINSLTFSPDGKTLACVCHGQTLRFVDRATGKDLHPVASHAGTIKSLVYFPDGKRVASASEDGTIRVWDAATGESLRVLRGHGGDVHGLALFPNGELLASCGGDGTFRLWDVESGKERAVLKDEGNAVRAAAFSADGLQLASGGNRCVIYLRDPAAGRILEEFEASAISSLAFSPDGKTLAALGGQLHLVHLGTKKTMKIPLERRGSCLAYSPDGKILAVACDETLLLLDPVTSGVLRRLPGHYNRRGCVVFSPDGRYLASVSDGFSRVANRTIRIFELATGTEIHPFAKELPVFAAAFSPDGSKLAVGGADATAVILDVRNLTGKKRRAELTEPELAARWESLAATEADKAYEARADLLHAPKSAIPFLGKRLQPAPPTDARRVEALIENLGSDSYRERDAATRELEHLGDLARSPLRKALAAGPPPETRRRLRALLGKLDRLTPAQLRHSRAVEILEATGTPEARGILERLSKGNADSLLTVESRTALARLQRKGAPLPPIPVARNIPAADSEPAPPPGPVRPDLDGDPMPAGAIARLGSARWRVTDEARRILVSPDGKTLAVVNGLAGVELLDARTGRCLERPAAGYFSWGTDSRMAVALSPGWRKMAGVGEENRLKPALVVFDRDTLSKVTIEYGRDKESYPLVPEEVEEAGGYFSSTSEYVSAVDFSPDGKALVASVRFAWKCSGDKVAKKLEESHLVAWDPSTGKERWKILVSAHEINTVLFSRDGKTVTVVDPSGVGFRDVATGRELRRWPSKDLLFSARRSPDGNWLATGGKDAVLLWEVATGNVVRRLAVPGKEIKAVAFSPDGTLLAGGGDKTIRFWDLPSGTVRGDCPPCPGPVQAVAFSGDGKALFSGHEGEHALRRWDVAGRKPAGGTDGPVSPARMLSFSRNGRTLMASSKGEEFYLWEARTGKPCPLLGKGEDRFFTEWLASSGQSDLLRCEEGFGAQFAILLTGKVDRLDQLPGFLGSSVDGRRCLIQSEKDKLPCLAVRKVAGDKGKGKEKLTEDVEREFVWKEGGEVSAALSPDGKTVAAAGKGVVCFFDVTTGRERRYHHPTQAARELFFRTRSIKFAADGSRIALAGDKGRVCVFAVKDGRRVAEFATKSRTLTGLAFSPDGQTLLTTSFNAPPCAWEVATGRWSAGSNPGPTCTRPTTAC